MPLNQVPSDPLTSTATRLSLPVARLDAAREMAKESSSAAARTRAVVSGDTRSEPRNARETVETETPARRATSSIVDSVIGYSRPRALSLSKGRCRNRALSLRLSCPDPATSCPEPVEGPDSAPDARV